MYIKIANAKQINLKNIKIDLKNKQVTKPDDNNQKIDKSGVEIEKSIVECKDLKILSNKCGIELISTPLSDYTRVGSTLIIDGDVHNKNEYKPSIIIENIDEDMTSGNLNKIIFKNENINIEDIYEKEIKENETPSEKTYEIYYKK